MIHPTEEMILAVRDREPVAGEVLTHLDECAACRRALEDARSRAEAIERALAALTVPVRTGLGVEGASASKPRRVAEDAEEGEPADGVIGRPGSRGLLGADAGRVPGAVAEGRRRADGTAGRGARVVPIGRGRRDAVRGTGSRGTVWTVRWLGRAAALVLIAAGALSALPGPFHGWIPRIFPRGPALVAPRAAELGPSGQVGGRMEIAGGPLSVRLENVAAGTVIDVRRVAGRAVGVLAATGSEFSYGGGEVRAAVVAGPVTVELPDGVVPATLIVNGATYLFVGAGGIETPGPATETVGESLVTFRVPN